LRSYASAGAAELLVANPRRGSWTEHGSLGSTSDNRTGHSRRRLTARRWERCGQSEREINVTNLAHTFAGQQSLCTGADTRRRGMGYDARINDSRKLRGGANGATDETTLAHLLRLGRGGALVRGRDARGRRAGRI